MSDNPDILHAMHSMEGALRGLIDRVETLKVRARTPVSSRAPSAPVSPAQSPQHSPSLCRAVPRVGDVAAIATCDKTGRTTVFNQIKQVTHAE
jgi:hypothetical protein